MTDPRKPREFKCLFDPETKELTYGHRHGCTDDFESIHVREVLPDRIREVLPQADGEIENRWREKYYDKIDELNASEKRVAELEKAVSGAEPFMKDYADFCEDDEAVLDKYYFLIDWLAKWSEKK